MGDPLSSVAQLILATIGVLLAGIGAALLAHEHDTTDVGPIVLGLVTALAALVMGLTTVVGILRFIPAWLARRGVTEFEVGQSQLRLVLKNSSSYPDSIARGDIVQLYVSNPYATSEGDLISTVVVRDAHGNIVHSGGGAREIGNALAKRLTESSSYVAVNAGGAVVKLAAHLSRSEAVFLMKRVEKAFGGQRPIVA